MLKPLLDRVLVKIIKPEDKTKSGIILANGTKENTQIAEVVQIGQGGSIDGEKIELYVKVGDKIILSKFCGTEVNYNGEDFLIVKQEDILAIIE